MDLIHRLRFAVKHAHEHITYSRYTTLWFFVIVIHCILQVSLQAITLADNAAAEHVLDVYLQEAGVPKAFTIIMGDALQTCNGIPTLPPTTCQIISNTPDDFDQVTTFNLTLPNGIEVTTSSQCVNSLLWLEEMFRDTMSEDFITLCFHFWLFAVSLLAILNDSIPHLAVCVASHLLDTAWAGFRIKATTNLRADYDKYIVQGACNGTDLLGEWWDLRMSHAIPTAACNAVVLAVILYLSWMLFWAFVRQTFSRVGASPVINRAYKLVLCFEANLELGSFFVLASSALWIDRISNGATAKDVRLFQKLFILTTVVSPLWVLSGWISIRREIRWSFLCFCLFQSIIIAVWLASFSSALYRYEVIQSPFFSCMTVTSFVFLLSTAIAGCICRLNFGKGLAHFLKVQAELNSADFTPGYFTEYPTSNSETENFSHFADQQNEKELRREEYFRESPDYGLNRRPSHSFRSSLKRLNDTARNFTHQKEGNHINFVPSLLSEPKFKLPIQPPPAMLLPGDRTSTRSADTVGSVGIIRYASRSRQSSALARTMTIPQDPKSTYVAP